MWSNFHLYWAGMNGSGNTGRTRGWIWEAEAIEPPPENLQLRRSIEQSATTPHLEKLLIASDGRERRTTINHAMKTCRRAWNVAARRNPGKVPPVNPFA